MKLPWFSQAFNQFHNRFQQRRLHHGLLFAGPKGIGKGYLAEELAALLLCKQPEADGVCGHCQSCKLFVAGNHADYHVLESDKQLGIDMVREAIGKLTATAQISQNKVLLIKGSETMTEAASNALLKTLEEPTANTYIILLTEQLQRLLPTILSRCEKHVLNAPSEHQCIEWLRAQGVEVDLPTLNAYGNAPFEVMAAMEQSDGLTYQSFTQGIEQLRNGEKDALTLSQKWQNDAEAAIQWCMRDAFERFRCEQHERDYRLYIECQSALTKSRHAGTNKVLILERVLSAINAH